MVLKYCLEREINTFLKRNSYHNVISNWDCIQISHNDTGATKGEFMEMVQH